MAQVPAGSRHLQVYHDYFAIRGGGERLVLELANAISAELIYGYRTAESYDEAAFPPAHKDLNLSGIRKVRGAASIALSTAFAQQRGHAAQADLRIYSGVAAPFAAPARDKPGVNVFYCHTPPRFLYDQKAFFREQSGPLRKLGLDVVGPLFQRAYEHAVERMHVIVANSVNIQKRIREHLGRESIVVYPPVDTSGFAWEPQQGYYLSTARLTPLKRIATIIDAFIAMPDKRLIIASGGDQEAELRARAAGAANIEFAGWTSDEQLRGLIAGAIATIYIPVEEDFGMSPVESMAAGKPVIGVAEGGLLETVLPEQTGVLLPPAPSASDLIGAINSLPPERALAMRPACETQALKFGRAQFIHSMRAVIDQALARS
ncbi:glycosyltransferase [Devosia sp. 63-57]|uniref:glycosyltransferase n=1 Tax=Devosia sp. 63-57 TaxID=1895751 RepID=UPI00086BB4BA|nr:glycosyltransferase [Devosia sp. 63-57]ODT47478.1 MAG: hypothetical protein ABS74_14500 [Pelagibacterium sp. SCN 63-126]ODU86107.1 MAG: hypothetical protein ABT14_09930 [Pelagibacterium sp. SCN 63-17]OJX42814.1 MAG: hypothetical protein BGO80_15365 [Devosia sp. 63-57]